MRRILSSPLFSRQLAAGAATVLLGALLVGCSNENDTATDVSSSESSAGTTSDSATPEPSPDAATSDPAAPETASGELPSWAPQIETDASDSVTGLDFSSIDPVSDQLLVAEVVTGDGPPVEAGQSITANYFGQLPDADAPFDESFSSAPFTAPIGVGSLIAGWDQGLVGIPVGSRVVMSIPPDLGYGDAGAGTDIPGGATLFFVIDIIDAS